MKFKVLFINLNEKASNWEKAKNIFSLLPKEMSSSLERIEAIDTRLDMSVIKKFNLKLDPVGTVNKLYFSQSPGAVGCFLSHVKAWQSIVEQDLDFALILEEDVVISDAINFLMSNPDLSPKKDELINLNGRNYQGHDLLNLEGSESYVLSKKGAKKLINFVINCEKLSCIEKIQPSNYSSWGGEDPQTFSVFRDEKLNFNKERSIIAPLDKFLGYCCNFSLNAKERLNYRYLPVIDLCKISSEFSTIHSAKKMYYDMNECELNEFMLSDSYCYWSKKYSTSLCICSFDNYKRLHLTLKHILKNIKNKREFQELIVLDNTSDKIFQDYEYNDSEKKKYFKKVKKLCNNFNFIKYVHCPTASLSHARNECIKQSNCDLVYFIDDDSEIDLDSVRVCSKQFNLSLNLSAVGGKVISAWPQGKKPEWVNESSLKYFSHVDHGEERFLLNQKTGFWLVGANICFKKSKMFEVGMFNQDLGRKGLSLLSGEDDEIITKIMQTNGLIMYHPEAIVRHIISEERCQPNWIAKRMGWQELTDILYTGKKSFNINVLKKVFPDFFGDKYSAYEKGLICSNLINFFLNQGFLPELKIPKIIHQIHMGKKPLSSIEKKWQKTWKTHNPDWHHILWTDEEISKLSIVNQKALDSCKNYSERSDILRFEILNKFGGLYIDTDFECLKPIEPMFAGKDFFICRQTAKELCGAFMACTAGHPKIKKIIDNVPQRLKEVGYKDFGPETSTIKYGPVYLTEILGVNEGEHPKYVYPYLWDQEWRAFEKFSTTSPESYAVHHWAGQSLDVDYKPFSRAFVISVSDKKYQKYKNIDFIELFKGIDTRSNYQKVLKKYNVEAKIDEPWRHHFYTNTPGNGSGAFGCSLSHMMLWEKIVQEGSEGQWYLILEDDASVKDVLDLSKNRTFDKRSADLINLNNRPEPWKEFDGSESYMLSFETAKKLLSYCKKTINAPADKVLFHPEYFRAFCDIKYIHDKRISMADDWKDSSL